MTGLADELARMLDQRQAGNTARWNKMIAAWAVTNSTAILTALRTKEAPADVTDEDETYEIGKQDGYGDALALVDLQTGGDGEYRFCTNLDPERHCPDHPAMLAKITARFTRLSAELAERIAEAGKARADAANLRADLAEARKVIAHTRTLVAACAPSGFTDETAVMSVYENNAALTAWLSQQGDQS